MAIDVPKNPKVYTTKYENFRGVDFTNDQTNVWYRRSPTGLNMLPDASGRPFKRHGWEILLSNEEICTYLETQSCSIQKCAYFEVGGVDHIAIFTDVGVAFYNVNGNFTAREHDYDCYSGYDRCFFFEGNGTSAFYIYGNFKMWRYMYDPTDENAVDGFVLADVTNLLTVPSVLISADANGAGTLYQGFNLLGSLASIEYSDNVLFTWWASDGLSVYVNDNWKTGKTVNTKSMYRYLWNGSSWIDKLSTGVAFDSTNINVVGNVQENDEIIILYAYGVMLPNNVSQAQITDMKVYTSVNAQYDYEMEVVGSIDPLASGCCRLWDDDTEHRESGRAWIQFYSSDVGDIDNPKLVNPIVAGEDYVKVTFPSTSVETTTYSNVQCTGTATLVGV